MSKNLEEEIYNALKFKNKQRCTLKERNVLLSELHIMETLASGKIETMFCNLFLNESVQLLINSIFLMEDGFYDCAFYSVRQSAENLNNMLLLASDKSKLEQWCKKEYFPLNNKVVKLLTECNIIYSEFKDKLKVFFDDYDNLIKQSHKIIHKQGFDTFYSQRTFHAKEVKFDKDKEIDFFVKLLRYSIINIYLIFIILDPIGLELADSNMNMRLNFNPMAEPINLDFIRENCPYDLIDMLHQTKFYNDLVCEYSEKEEMNVDTYSVIRDNFFNLEALDNIEKQRHLLSPQEQFMLSILQTGLRISNFQIGGINILPYWTSEKCNYSRYSTAINEFDCFKQGQQFNNRYYNVFISRINMFDSLLFLEHNKELTNEEINLLQEKEKVLNPEFYKLTKKQF